LSLDEGDPSRLRVVVSAQLNKMSGSYVSTGLDKVTLHSAMLMPRFTLSLTICKRRRAERATLKHR
jgi:hypothetical protein